jgi:O-antigen/teichoic acid export membrane protein
MNHTRAEETGSAGQAVVKQGPGLAGVAALNAAAILGARLTALIVGILLTPFVLHRLGRDLYGIAVAAGALLDYLWLLRGGLGSAMRRYVTVSYHAGDRELAERYYSAGFWWTAVLRTVVVLVGASLAHGLCLFMRVPPSLLADATGGLVLIIIAAGLSDTGGILEMPIYVTGHTAPVSLVRAAGAVLKIALVVPALLIFVPSLTVYGVVLCAAELLVAVVIGIWSARQRIVSSVFPRPEFGSPVLRKTLFQFASLGLVSQAAAILYLATDNLLIGRIYGPAQVTEYSLGTRWAPMISGVLYAGVSALAPLLTQMDARGEVDRTRRVVLRAVAFSSALGVPVCLVPCVVGDVFLARWVGPEYQRSATYMIAMLVPTLVAITMDPIWMTLVARGRIGWIALSDIIVAVANPVLSLVLALHFHLGLLGFALGNTAALLAKNLLLRPLLNRGETALPSLRATLLTLPVALAGGAPALLLLYFLKPFYSHSLMAIVGAGVAGGLLCLAGSLLTAVGWRDTRGLAAALVIRLRSADSQSPPVS